MKEGRKPEYPEKTPGYELSENVTYYSPKCQAPSETRTRAVALVTGLESRHANRYTTSRPSGATNRFWRIKVLDTWKVTQLNILRQKSVKSEEFLSK